MRSRQLAFGLALGVTVSVLAALPSAAVPGRTAAVSAARADAFRELPGFVLDKGSDRLRVRPRHFAAYAVDKAAVRASLAAGTISLPDPSGRMVTFDVVEDPVMQSELAAAHPEIRTYAGRATDGSRRSARFDNTPMGFHASVRSPRGSWYIDPAYNRRGETRHVSYYGASMPAAPEGFVERDLVEATGEAAEAAAPTVGVPGGPVTRRTYRMAFVTDPTYAAYFGTANVLAEKVTLINRTNQVYNDDLAIRFVLVTTPTSSTWTLSRRRVGPTGRAVPTRATPRTSTPPQAAATLLTGATAHC